MKYQKGGKNLRYLIKRGDEQFGPFLIEELYTMLQEHVVSLDDYVLSEDKNESTCLSDLNFSPHLIKTADVQNSRHRVSATGLLYLVKEEESPVYHPKSLSSIFNAPLQLFFEKPFSWTLFVSFPIISSSLFFLYLSNKPPQTKLFPDLPLILQIIFLFYFNLSNLLMIVYAASQADEGINFEFRDLLFESQKKILRGLSVIFTYTVAFLCFYCPLRLTQLFQNSINLLISLLGALLAALCFFPLPYLAVIGNTGFLQLFPFSLQLTKQYLRRIGLFLFLSCLLFLLATGAYCFGLLLMEASAIGGIIYLVSFFITLPFFIFYIFLVCVLFTKDLLGRASLERS